MINRATPGSLRDTWFGTRLPEAALARLEALARPASYAVGAEILREGDPTRDLGVVVRGRVALRLRVPERGPTSILTVEEGDIIGWSVVVPPHRATSTVVALVPTELLLIDGTALRAALDADPCSQRPCTGRCSRRSRTACAARGCSSSTCSRARWTSHGEPADRGPRPGFLPRAGLDRLLDLLRPTAAASSDRRSAAVPSSTTRSTAPPTCPPAGRPTRRRASTGSARRGRTASSTTPSGRRPGSARPSRPASRSRSAVASTVRPPSRTCHRPSSPSPSSASAAARSPPC